MSSRLVLLLALAGCVPRAGESSQAIIGGNTDTTDTSVVLIFSEIPGATTGTLCTGSVVSPHVIMTAAHCVSPDFVGAGAQFSIYGGTSATTAHRSDFIAAKEAHFDPDFSASDITKGHDIGVVVMNDALTQAPLAMNLVPLARSMVDQPARMVGYGQSTGDDDLGGATIGTRREVATVMDDFTDTQVHFGSPGAEACEGDSGGPAFMTIEGKEAIVGVVSYGDAACAHPVVDTRVDVFAGFVIPFITTNDPGFDPGMPAKSGGCDLAPHATSPTLLVVALLLAVYLRRQ